jgi:hypothetical protein
MNARSDELTGHTSATPSRLLLDTAGSLKDLALNAWLSQAMPSRRTGATRTQPAQYTSAKTLRSSANEHPYERSKSGDLLPQVSESNVGAQNPQRGCSEPTTSIRRTIPLTDDLFATGTAALINTSGKYAIIRCPHCQGHHAHEKSSVGSRAVLAACSSPIHPRTYAIPRSPKVK